MSELPPAPVHRPALGPASGLMYDLPIDLDLHLYQVPCVTCPSICTRPSPPTQAISPLLDLSVHIPVLDFASGLLCDLPIDLHLVPLKKKTIFRDQLTEFSHMKTTFLQVHITLKYANVCLSIMTLTMTCTTRGMLFQGDLSLYTWCLIILARITFYNFRKPI